MTSFLLNRVHDVLTVAQVPHALIGAAALAVHGVSRSTFDLDILVTERRVLTRDMWAPLTVDAHVDVRAGDDGDPLAGVVRITSGEERDVDIVVGRYDWQAAIIEEADPLDGSAESLRVATAAGLVLLKLYAGGPQDLWDIEQVRAIGGPELDAAVSSRIAALPSLARDTWARLASPQ